MFILCSYNIFVTIIIIIIIKLNKFIDETDDSVFH
jgi:hypothetical protein